MKLFEFNAVIKNEEWDKRYNDREAFRIYCHDIADITSEFNNRLKPDDFICLTGAKHNEAQFTAIIRSKISPEKLFHSYVKALGLELLAESEDEIILEATEANLRRANRMEILDDEDEVINFFNLDFLINRRFGPRFPYSENIIDDYSKESLQLAAQRLFTNQSLLPEIERIYSVKRKGHFVGHPVHYIIETDDRDCRRETYKNILRALHANNRIENKRYAFIDVNEDNNIPQRGLAAVYESNAGGTVVLRFDYDADSEDDTADASRELVEMIANFMNKNRNRVLTVLCLPKACTNLKSIFNEYLSNISFVHITEEAASGEKACDYLKYLAKENNIKPDKKLFESVEEGKDYYGPDLVSLFTRWQDMKIKNKYYPEYKMVESTKKTIAKEQAKGSAYDELMNMIGIEDAKKVINQALDFFKAKKMFADRGLDTEEGAMHMIFTGNPGTAKTTVARLFARIMRENKILEYGHIVEVGRGDLVGKYVGWTAPTIQKKFKEARGGVLFIDEAYSLVDDRSGSFGDEAINTIVQEMENHRNDVVVIFAGYPDKMEQFLQKNPGLRSRIAFHIPFKDYTAKDLCDIAKLMAGKKSIRLDDEACVKLTGIFEAARAQTDFGNGRYVRNILEKAKLAQATRLVHMDYDSVTDEDVKTIRAVDIEAPVIGCGNNRKSIGFC